MAIIVDKVQKRKDIALSCKELIFNNGIKDLTISQIAKTAGVGKGTIYEYFNNKEDIVFEIVNIMILERNIAVEEKLSKLTSTKDKIKLFSSFFYINEDEELRKLYKEFVSIALSSPDEDMKEFQTQCFDVHYLRFEQIIQEAIDKGELIKGSLSFARGLFVSAEGMFIASEATNSIQSVEREVNKFIDALFDLIEIKK